MKRSANYLNIKKGDIVIFITIGFVILLSTILFYTPKKEAKVLKIYQNSTEYASFSLSPKYARTFYVPTSNEPNAGYNRIRIENGEVSITESTCPNKDCIKMGKISQAGDMLICLPHKLILRLEGGDTVDAISY